MLRNRRAAAGEDAAVRRPLGERDVNVAHADRPGARAAPVKAKQSPAVNRQREPEEALGASSSSSARSMGVLKIPTRLAGPQVQRIEHGKLPSKRPDLSHDDAVESPYKRVRHSGPGADGTAQDQPVFMPLSLSLGGLAAPVVSGAPLRARGRGGPLRAPPRDVQQAGISDATPSHADGSSHFMEELKAKLRQREERKAGMSDLMGMGMKDIRDVFLNFIHTFKNFTSEILREDGDDSDEWEWTEHATSPALKRSPGAGGGGAVTPPGNDKAGKKHAADLWDDDPWSNHEDKKATMGARVGSRRMESAGMRGPCTPSSLLLEKRLSSPPGSRGKLSKLTGKMNNLRKGHLTTGSPRGYNDLLGGHDGSGGGSARLRHSPGGGSSSPMLNSVYNALEERLMISPGCGVGGGADAMSALGRQKDSGGLRNEGCVSRSAALMPRKAADAPKLLWNIQQGGANGTLRLKSAGASAAPHAGW
jgi:hypothetical protein